MIEDAELRKLRAREERAFAMTVAFDFFVRVFLPALSLGIAVTLLITLGLR